MTATEINKKIIFLSYAIDDQEPGHWLKRLQVQLEPLKNRYNFDVWDEINKLIKNLANKSQCKIMILDDTNVSFINSDGIIIKHFSFD